MQAGVEKGRNEDDGRYFDQKCIETTTCPSGNSKMEDNVVCQRQLKMILLDGTDLSSI